ncbi:trimeric LpxA-like protein [Aspergillus avenaceus]|uniref:Trimeric LpxA-like protein n=1 Tax=Aspergillus avenaceus TaxID=36643 RepID=A0A5N6TVA8_ASPAV|nr:trimeric LpxA-like protein [Aspergillus avenaceus]
MGDAKEPPRMLCEELRCNIGEDMGANHVRCKQACEAFNAAENEPRRCKVERWREIIGDTRPLPPEHPDPDADEALFEETDPFVNGPISVDHGINLHVGKNTFLNSNLRVLDTCEVRIGDRVLLGPNVNLYGATHPMDPALRQEAKGPNTGQEIVVEDDVWLGGSVVVVAGVRIGRGSTVGAGSVVTRDVPPFHFVAGNPAHVIRRIETTMDPDHD